MNPLNYCQITSKRFKRIHSLLSWFASNEIVAYDDAGRPLLDIDVLPSEKQNTLHLPVQSDYLAVTGYGGNEGMFDTENQDSGSLSLNYSTDDTWCWFPPKDSTRIISNWISLPRRIGDAQQNWLR